MFNQGGSRSRKINAIYPIESFMTIYNIWYAYMNTGIRYKVLSYTYTSRLKNQIIISVYIYQSKVVILSKIHKLISKELKLLQVLLV